MSDTASDQPEGTRGDTGSEPSGRPRRRILAASAIGAGGLVAGAAAGMPLLSGAGTPPIIEPSRATRFTDKVVIITGATSGIGRAAAVQFAAEGGLVAFCGRRVELGRQVEAQIRDAGGEASYFEADVRDEQSVKKFIDDAVDAYGRIDVCFNNAGITIQKPLHEYEVSEWDDVVNTNLRGTFLSLKYQVPHLIEAGGGVVVVTSSSNAITTGAEKSAYTASKRGLVGLVQSVAFDYADQGIRINSLIPGTTDTELVRRAAGMMDLPDAAWQEAAAVFGASAVPAAKRLATAEEIASFALALASDDFPYMTASQLVIDGGTTAYAG